MICSKCKAEIKKGEKFCSQCGTKVQRNCPKCGSVVRDVNFCPSCGYRLEQETGKTENIETIIKTRQQNVNKSSFDIYSMKQEQQKTYTNEQEDADKYEDILAQKAKKESIGNTIVFILIGILCLILVINNWGYSELTEIIFMCGCVSIFILAVYFAIAVSMGFYGANKYLQKYHQMKSEIGKVEAVKMIEQQYNPNDGFAMLKGGINATEKGMNAAGGCIGGCFSSIIGFAVTIIMIIMIMAFC